MGAANHGRRALSAAADDFELYAGEGTPVADADGEAQRLFVWRMVRFLATLQLEDLKAEHAELAAMLERSFEPERSALTAVLERAKREIRG